jgi:hypothetical protein
VADYYGVGGIPSPPAAIGRPTVRAFFTAPDGQGLADRTQRRFFSEGTLPSDGVVEYETTAADLVREARRSLTYALPTLSHLDLRTMGVRRYVMVNDGDGAAPRRLLAYERVPGRVRFFLDGRVHADTARVLLPEVAGYAAGLINHLFRAEVKLSRDGELVRATVVAPAGHITGGPLRLYAEDGAGRRRELASFPAGAAGAPEGVSVAVPKDARRIGAVQRGRDDAGPVVAIGELALPARR